jgi:hypothetical protein
MGFTLLLLLSNNNDTNNHTISPPNVVLRERGGKGRRKSHLMAKQTLRSVLFGGG